MIHASALGDSGTSQPYVKHILYSIFNNIFPRQKPAGYSHPAGFCYINPQERRPPLPYRYASNASISATQMLRPSTLRIPSRTMALNSRESEGRVTAR